MHLFPTQPQLTGKRKLEESNPLLNAAAAKRAKKEAKSGPSSKRKHNNEESAGGLLIVRAPESQPQPSHSQPQPTTSSHHVGSSLPPRFGSQPLPSDPSSSAMGLAKPAAKKFKADGHQTEPRPRATSSKPATTRDRVGAYSTAAAAYDDSEVEKDVRAMEDEADHLRRNSRAHTTIDSSLVARRRESGGVQFLASRSEPPANATGRSKGKQRVIDVSAEVPESETPRIERNKQMRQGAMDAYNNSLLRTPEPNAKNQHVRRISSVGRGKRTSTSFEATGIITQPHNSVSESSFYKHIDCDLPEPERIRQLLIWCSLRASSTSLGSSSKSKPSKSKSKPSLPPLSAEGAQVLESVQKDVIRMLAERKIDLSLYSSQGNISRQPAEDLRENEQNVRNRMCEVRYSRHIQQCQVEEESWKKVSYGYDAYAKKLQVALETRAAGLQLDQQSQGMSAKAKGKRRATGDGGSDLETSVMPQEYELAAEFHPALALAKTVLGHGGVGDDRRIAASRRGTTRLDREEMEAEIKRRLPGLEYKVDRIFSMLSCARTATDVGEKWLNERFDILSANLTSRINPFLEAGEGVGGGSSSTQLLSTYVREGRSRSAVPDPLDLMRALSRVDQERPPTQVGDAARRAAREVQRVDEKGVAAVGDRRLTEVPATPKRAPGTPRRGNTPSRGG